MKTTTNMVRVFSAAIIGLSFSLTSLATTLQFENIATPGNYYLGSGNTYSGDFDSLAMDNINVSSVPAPPAAFLFGSALLGGFGFRRKLSK